MFFIPYISVSQKRVQKNSINTIFESAYCKRILLPNIFCGMYFLTRSSKCALVY